jgi:hypothetical protein
MSERRFSLDANQFSIEGRALVSVRRLPLAAIWFSSETTSRRAHSADCSVLVGNEDLAANG